MGVMVGLMSAGMAQADPSVQETAQDAGQPTAERIVERFIEATGGRAAWESMSSLRGFGTIEVSGAPLTGQVAIYQTADGFRMSVDAGGVPAQVTVRRGDEAWSLGAGGEVRELTGPELRKVQRDRHFNPLLNPDELYSALTLEGVEQVGEANAWKVRCTPRDDSEAADVRFFDVDSGLQVKVIEQGAGPAGAIPTELYLHDYRAVGDVRIPYRTEISLGRGGVVITMLGMQANTSIPDCLFDRPTGEMVPPPRESPRAVLEALMATDPGNLTVAQCRDLMARIDQVLASADGESRDARQIVSALKALRKTLVERINEEAGAPQD